MLFDRIVTIEFLNHQKRDQQFNFSTRHLIGSCSRKGNTIVVMNLAISNPIFTSRTDKHDNYDRRKGVLTCLQKFIWKYFEWQEQTTYDIVSFRFNQDGSIDLSVAVRNEETAADGMWWLNSTISTGMHIV